MVSEEKVSTPDCRGARRSRVRGRRAVGGCEPALLPSQVSCLLSRGRRFLEQGGKPWIKGLPLKRSPRSRPLFASPPVSALQTIIFTHLYRKNIGKVEIWQRKDRRIRRWAATARKEGTRGIRNPLALGCGYLEIALLLGESSS